MGCFQSSPRICLRISAILVGCEESVVKAITSAEHVCACRIYADLWSDQSYQIGGLVVSLPVRDKEGAM